MEIIQVHPSSQNAQPDPTHVKPKRRRSTKEDGVLRINKRVRIPPICIPAIFHLKQELGLRSDGEIVQWLLHQLRPELVPSTNTKPLNSPWTRQPVKLPVPKPVCMDYLNDHQLTSYLPVPSAGALATRQSIRATVVQASSVFFDTPATLDKAERLIAGAAAYGSQLVVFPEAFLGGYPRCLTFATATDDDLQKYYASAIDVPGPEVDRLAKVAGKYKVHLVMGVVERAGFYLFSTVLFFDSLGQHLGQHRKLMPMASEIAVWYSGEKSSLPVYETSIGKVGGLICWDNKWPLLRTELYAKGIEIYCAPSADAREIWKSSMIHIALEGGCFVLSANQFCRRRDYPLPPGGSDSNVSLDETTCSGGSVIVSPSGTVLAGPNYQGECLISADLDLVEISRAKKEFGTVRSNLKPNHVGWTESGPNPILLATDIKAEVPNELSW